MESIPQIGGTTQQIILYGNITIITVLFLCNFLLTDCEQKLSLITANTLITNTYVWNLITCSFYETNIVKIAIDITILYVITKNITITNWEQFSIFFGFTLLACSLITSTYYFFRFLFTSMEDFLILPTYGFDGVLMLLMVYARQQFKGQVIHPVAATITYNNLPIVFLAYLFIITILGLRILCMDVMFGLISLLFSWSYLRFYYRYNEGDAPGDSAEDFTFVGMFPEVIMS